jgi:hypothetical protein
VQKAGVVVCYSQPHSKLLRGTHAKLKLHVQSLWQQAAAIQSSVTWHVSRQPQPARVLAVVAVQATPDAIIIIIIIIKCDKVCHQMR